MVPRKSHRKKMTVTQRRRQTVRRLSVEKLNDRRVLAAITGAVFGDQDHSFGRSDGEGNVPSRLVYIDANANAQLDAGERVSLADSGGTFGFNDLADGTYSLRLYNGTSTQIQTVPVETDGLASSIALVGGTDFIKDVSATQVITDDSVVSIDAASGFLTPISVADNVTLGQRLPDGSLLVIGTDSSVATAWRVEPSTSTVTPVDLSGVEPAVFPLPQYSDLAIDGNGRGVAIESGSGLVPIRSIDASDPATGITVSVTSTFVPGSTSVVTSSSGSRSVFATPNAINSGVTGLDLSLWSNTTASLISSSATNIEGASELLTFDDASGLLALRTASGGVSVHDVDANFAALHAIDRPLGPIVIDGARDLLFAITADNALLTLYDLTNGELIADLAVDFADIGTPVSMSVGSSSEELVILGTTGLAEIALNKPAAIEITIANQEDVDSAIFGVALKGANTAPRYESVPTFETEEDEDLIAASPALLSVTTDDEADNFVLIQVSEASDGIAVASLNGSLDYTPDDDFNGEDSFDVVLHDGRDVSESATIVITVNAVDDPLESIEIDVPPFPEDTPIGDPVGDVEVVDGDGGGHIFVVDDDRFMVEDGKIIFVGGVLDFETQPIFDITVTATDTGTGDMQSDSVSVTLLDANDPILGITPDEAFVFENSPGSTIAILEVDDQDIENEQEHSFRVENDDRFIVVGAQLRLADGVALDFEVEPSVVILVTATETDTGNSFSQEITIRVEDAPEQPQGLALTNSTVLELVDGAVVGDVLIDGSTPPSRFELTVNSDQLEIAGSTLKVRDDQFVTRESGAQIVVEITATDTQNEFSSVTEEFVIEVLENQTPAHNQDNPFDVSHGDGVTAQDALLIINYLNTFGPGPVGSGDLGFCYDVNADGMVTALDALLVVNRLNLISSGDGGVGGEDGDGEQEPEGELILPQSLETKLASIDQRLAGGVDPSTLSTLASDQRPSPTIASPNLVRDQTLLESDDFDISKSDHGADDLTVDELVQLLSDVRL